MLYTIGDAAKKLGVQPSALRYYDKEGLLPHMERSDGGMRMFTEDDFEWFRFIERLKNPVCLLRKSRNLSIFMSREIPLSNSVAI